MTAESARARAAPSDRHTGGWGYAAALTPIIFGTTYVLTTEFLPPGSSFNAAGSTPGWVAVGEIGRASCRERVLTDV